MFLLKRWCSNVLNVVEEGDSYEIESIFSQLFSVCDQEVPDNKRRVSIVKGMVIARRNAGLNSTIRIRRQVAGVGVESLFPL